MKSTKIRDLETVEGMWLETIEYARGLEAELEALRADNGVLLARAEKGERRVGEMRALIQRCAGRINKGLGLRKPLGLESAVDCALERLAGRQEIIHRLEHLLALEAGARDESDEVGEALKQILAHVFFLIGTGWGRTGPSASPESGHRDCGTGTLLEGPPQNHSEERIDSPPQCPATSLAPQSGCPTDPSLARLGAGPEEQEYAWEE
jgi:hypothetical protein